MIESIWNGVYGTFQDVPASGDGFSGDCWTKKSLSKVAVSLEAARSDQGPSVAVNRDSLLPFLISMLTSFKGEVVVVDFGGGVGQTFIDTMDALPDSTQVSFHIVEMESVCEHAARLFEGDDRIHFHTEFPKLDRPIDVIHLGSSLQYVEDWKAMLQNLAEQAPEFLLLGDLMAGDVQTYATAQTYYESQIPCWFFNQQEVVDHLQAFGFSLAFASLYVARILGKEQELPQHNFSPEFRVGRGKNLLFRMNKK